MGSGRPDLGSDRPDWGSERPILRLRRLFSKLGGGQTDGRRDGGTDGRTGELLELLSQLKMS